MNARTALLKDTERNATRHCALGEAIRWHEGRIKFYRKEIRAARKWSRANNDGDPDLGGTLYTDHYPDFIKAHLASIKAMKHLQLNRPV